MYYLPTNETVTRKQSFNNATIFSDYVWKEGTLSPSRVKYLMRSSSEAALSRSKCVGCSKVMHFSEHTALILHFQVKKYEGVVYFDDSMKSFTPQLQKQIAKLF